MLVDDTKLEILVDGKNIYAGAPVHYTESGGKLTITTEIGKAQKQSITIVATKMNYVDPLVDDDKKVVNE